jgi:hypothetical protein
MSFFGALSGAGAGVAPSPNEYYKIPAATFPEFTAQLWHEGAMQVYTDYVWNAIPDLVTGTTGYVDLDAGSNGNGTIGSPYNTMASLNASSYNIFYIKGKGRQVNSVSAWTKNVKLLPWPGFPMPELTTQTNTDLVWTQNGTQPTVYDATWPSGSGFITNVCDRAVLDSNGSYTGYMSFTSLANVAAAAGRFWYESGTNTLHVRTIDGRVPDANIVGLVGAGSIIGATASLSANRYVYIEGIRTLGGAYGLFMGNAGASAVLYVGVKDCEFSSAGGTEAAAYISGRTQGYYRNCKSFYNRDDAFDYNSTSSSLFFEWYNKSGKNTYTGLAINGSTSHENSRVIRVGCEYLDTAGKCMQDINNSKSWNLRITAGGARAAAPDDFSYATNSVTGLTEMWLIECTTTVAKGYTNFTNSILNVYDGTVGNLQTATNSNTGTLNILTESDVYL